MILTKFYCFIWILHDLCAITKTLHSSWTFNIFVPTSTSVKALSHLNVSDQDQYIPLTLAVETT